MQPLERDHVLRQLGELVQRPDRAGRLAVVTGEAGIGKSTVVEALARQESAHAEFLAGACDPLMTPVPLGPVRDLARQIGGEFDRLVSAGAGRERIFDAFHRELQGDRRRVIVVEDLHWADEATLDLLRFIGRRIESLNSVLIVTCRDDDASGLAGLRRILGDVASRVVCRIRLVHLSARAVSTLAASAGRSDEGLHQITGGNPFYVTEALASTSGEVPVSVRDAVLARVSALSPEQIALVEAVSVSPGRIERWLLDSMIDDSGPLVDACVERGILRDDGTAVSFRHELARLAIESELPPNRRRRLHELALGLLEDRDDVVLGRLVHHAAGAGAAEAVLRLAPAAASNAAAVGAHREAAAHYRTALEFGAALDADMRARLLESLAYECYLTDQIPQALRAREEALQLRRSLNDDQMAGVNLRWRSRLLWFLGEGEEAARTADEAIIVLARLPATRELALAYSNRAQLHMLSEERDQAIAIGLHAIELARELDDPEVLAHALNNVGTAESLNGMPSGRERLERSLSIALEHGFEEHVARAWTNLGSSAVRMCAYRDASALLGQGIAYSEERDLAAWSSYMRGWRARLLFETGDWTGAAEDAARVLSDPGASPVSRMTPLTVMARIRARRGDPGVSEVLEEALSIAARTREPQRIEPALVAAAEIAWLRGDEERVAALASELEGRLRDLPFGSGEMAFYMRMCDLDPIRDVAPPWCAGVEEEWRYSAEEWARLDRPYEQALALMRGDDDARAAAVVVLEKLGAAATARIARRAARSRGNRNVAAGRSTRRRSHPSGLSDRQLEVLALMSQGMRNSEIAERLFVSARTVEHHVSAILETLSARSRAEAAVRARELGLHEIRVTASEK